MASAFALVTSAMACGGGTIAAPDDAPDLRIDSTLTASSYNLAIFGEGPAAGRYLQAEDVGSYYDQASGIIYLGADDVAEPLGTLTMTIGPVLFREGSWNATILSVVLSTTAVSVGTSDELQARTFSCNGPLECRVIVDNIRIGTNYISGSVNLAGEENRPYLTRSFIPSGERDEIVGFSLGFWALE